MPGNRHQVTGETGKPGVAALVGGTRLTRHHKIVRQVTIDATACSRTHNFLQRRCRHPVAK